MSVSGVSLVVLQLEISSNSKPLSHLHYIAPKFAKSHALPPAEFAVKAAPTSEADLHKKKRRGWRDLADFTIETLTGDAMDHAEDENNGPAEYMESTKAILQLFKENQTTQLAEEAERSEMVCILAVPTDLTTSNLLHFTDSVCKDIEYMRVIRRVPSNHYMALIKFTHQLAADEFFKNFNGVPFGPRSAHICHLVYVAQVITIQESPSSCSPLLGHTELPTCPVCLERMDESVEGILSSDISQASNWNNSNCVVCQLCQAVEENKKLHCFGCGALESLWICLICGSVGCGRYVEGHAYSHFMDTLHTFALQLGNSRVWDYAGDNYVHRLLAHDKPARKPQSAAPWSEQEEKLDSLQLEYTYLLTSQLEAQRHFFEDQMIRVENECHRNLEEVKEKARQSTEERKAVESALCNASQEKQAAEAQLSALTARHQQLQAELKAESRRNTQLNRQLSESQDQAQALEQKLAHLKESLNVELEEMRQQINDLQFYLQAQSQLKALPEAKEGSIGVTPLPTSGRTSRHRHSRSHR